MTIININITKLGIMSFFWLKIIRNNAYKYKGFRLNLEVLEMVHKQKALPFLWDIS